MSDGRFRWRDRVRDLPPDVEGGIWARVVAHAIERADVERWEQGTLLCIDYLFDTLQRIATQLDGSCPPLPAPGIERQALLDIRCKDRTGIFNMWLDCDSRDRLNDLLWVHAEGTRQAFICARRP